LTTRILPFFTITKEEKYNKKTAKQTEEEGDKEKKRKTYFLVILFKPLVKKRAFSYLLLVSQLAEK